jgi:hypothetical protein
MRSAEITVNNVLQWAVTFPYHLFFFVTASCLICLFEVNESHARCGGGFKSYIHTWIAVLIPESTL